MTERKKLSLYEEVMLLALRDKKGTVATAYAQQAIAGAVLAELLLDQRISVDQTKKQLVMLQDGRLTGDPIIDECLEKMTESKRRASLKTWVTRLARIKHLRHKVARHLCRRRILREDEDKVLLFFTRKIYPEIDPAPEREIIRRLRAAVFSDNARVDPRTVVLISLANAAGLLAQTFGRKEIRARRKRIEKIVSGEVMGKATKEVIAAAQAAVAVAVMVPAVIAATSSS